MAKCLRIVLLFMSLFISAAVSAQNQGALIKGTITDEKDVTLPGVSILVKGTNRSAVSDINL